MAAFALHMMSLLLVGAWVKWIPCPRLRTLGWLWFLGLLLYTCLPSTLIARLFLELGHPLPPGVVDHTVNVGVWIGALLVLRALLGLTLWSRSDRRWERVWFLLFVGWLLMLPFVRPGNAWSVIVFPLTSRGWIDWLCVLLPIPWLWSYRWRDGRGFVAHLGILGLGLCSLVLLSTQFTSLTGGFQGGITLSRGLMLWEDPDPLLVFAGTVWQCGPLYLLLFLPHLAARAHLSIRRISLRLVGSHILAGLVPLGLLALIVLLVGALFLSGYR